MKTLVGHSPCPECPSSDGFAIYDHGDCYSGYCYVCGHTISEKYARRIDWEPPEVNVTNTSTTKTNKGASAQVKARELLALTRAYRKAPKECWVDAGVGYTDSGKGAIAYPYFALNSHELKGYKVRGLTLDSKGKKRMWIEGSVTGCLFNPYLIWNGKWLCLTEGEDDAVVGHYMFPDIDGTFMSIPNGTNSKLTDEMVTYLNENWEVIVLAFDADEPGQKAALEWQQRIGRKCRIAKLGEYGKDACEYRENNAEAEFISAIESAERPESKHIISSKTIREGMKSFLANEEQRYGVPTGIRELDEITGLRLGEVSVLLGDTGTGKSTLFRVIIANLLERGEPVLVLSMEERPEVVATRILEHIYHRPIIDSDLSVGKANKLIDKGCSEYLDGRLHFGSLFGVTEAQQIKEVVEDAIELGVRFVAYDGVTVGASGSANPEAQIRQTMMVLNGLAVQHKIHVMAISHKSRGSDLDLYAGFGSSAIEHFAHLFFVFSTHGADETKRYIEIAKNRMQGRRGKGRVCLAYDESTCTYD